MLKRSAAAFVAVLVGAAGLVVPAEAAQPTAKKYSSCAKLLDKYPNGVARNKKARNKAVRQGFERPQVRKRVYKDNRKRLDKDGNGVVCEQQAAQPTSFKTDFGFITAEPVKPPKPGECVSVPITMDVRSLNSVGIFGMTVRLVSEFGSVVAYDELSTNEGVVYPYMITTPGEYEIQLKTCGDPHTWTHVSGNRVEPVSAVRADEEVELVFYRWLGDSPLGSADYTWA